MDRDGWNDRYETAEYIWNANPNQFVAEHLGDLAPGDAIDLAAGEGRNAVWLAEQGWRATAVDFSDVALTKARRLAEDRDVSIETIAADVTAWEPTSPVDLVVLAYLQLPSDVQESVLRRVAGWVRPSGTVFVIAHDRSNVAHGHGGPSVEDVCYDAERTAAALAPLEIDRAEVVERRVDTPDGERVALDTLVIAHRADDA
jgi:2-polyprenyl-3-methyl-5-hydroxy-6-metoxy-1,4-benzoquinol methylase